MCVINNKRISEIFITNKYIYYGLKISYLKNENNKFFRIKTIKLTDEKKNIFITFGGYC